MNRDRASVRSCLSDGTKMTQRLTVLPPFAAPVQHMPPGPHWHQGLPLSEREDCVDPIRLSFQQVHRTQAEVQAAALWQRWVCVRVFSEPFEVQIWIQVRFQIYYQADFVRFVPSLHVLPLQL